MKVKEGARLAHKIKEVEKEVEENGKKEKKKD